MNDKDFKLRNHSISDLYLLALFSIFAIISLFIVVLGARVYQDISLTTDQNNEVRSSLFYVSNKVRSADQTENVSIELRSGVTVLVLGGLYTDNLYETLLYYYDGSIRELLIKKNSDFDPKAGESIIRTKGFAIKKNGSLLIFSITAEDENTYTMHMKLQSRE